MSVDERATISVCSPPHPNSGLPEFGTLDGRSRVNPTSAGEGLGVGVVRFCAGGATEISLHHPPPQPSPTRLRACALPANLKVPKPRQAGVWVGEGADRVRRSS